MGIKITLIFAFAANIFFSNQSNAESYFRLSKQFFNEPKKLQGKTIAPFKYVVIKKNDEGKYNFTELEQETASVIDDKCFFQPISNNKINYDYKFLKSEPLVLGDSPASILKVLFVSSRVDTVIDLSEENKINFYLWGSKTAAFQYAFGEDESYDIGKAVSAFCGKLNYNGIVVDVSKDIITVLSSVKEVRPKSQTAVYGNHASKVFIVNKGNKDASAILQLIESKDKIFKFKKIIGKVNTWDKVWILPKPPAKKKAEK